MRGQALAVASAVLALAAVAPVPAFAYEPPSTYNSYSNQDYDCQRIRQQRMVAGGVIGAIAGAVLGSNVSGRGAKSEGGALGAVAGAVAGGAIGRSSAKCGPYNNTSYNGPYNGNTYRSGNNDGYGLDGGPYAPTGYRSNNNGNYGNYNNGRDCRYGQETLRDPDGRAYQQSVYMCRGNDGVWRPEGG